MENIKIIKKLNLFDEISEEDLSGMLYCLQAKTTDYKKNEFVWIQGDENYSVGIVLSGKINVLKEDIAGNRNLIASISAPSVFGESLVCSEIARSPVSVQAATDSTIMTIEFLKLVKVCHNSCPFHTRLIQNMLKIIALKNLNLNDKINYLKKKTTQQKIASYILNHLSEKETMISNIPLNREELADYLGVNRSALSRELGKMRDNGWIKYKKNTFEILDLDALTMITNE